MKPKSRHRRPVPASASDNGLVDYIAAAKYTQRRPDGRGRESWSEAVTRVEQMHRTHFAGRLARRIAGAGGPADPADRAWLRRRLAGATIGQALADAFAAVAAKRVLPSMRSLQFGGAAILGNHARLYNCAFSPADRLGFFREYFFLLLGGTGCGFSVQRAHVGRLPPLAAAPVARRRPVARHVVVDTIEGWADALHALLRHRFAGGRLKLVFAGRPAPGRARARRALQSALFAVDTLLDRAAGRRLRPVEVYDLCMFLSRAVLAGGARRAASLCLFSPDDEEMLHAKTGRWLELQPQRAASNLSAALLRSETRAPSFRRLLTVQREFGEPGFYFSDSAEYGCNPCGEIGLHPVVAGPLPPAERRRLRACGYRGPLGRDLRLSGWQLCNLTTINAAAVRSADDFLRACVDAAVIGTLQAAYTHIPYLGPVTRYLNERDALLGVSICGVLDNPRRLLNARLLQRGARLCRTVNAWVAAALGIRPAARVTCVKPEGTAALLLGTAPGIHPHPARRYLRRVWADPDDPVCRRFAAVNPAMTEAAGAPAETGFLLVFPVAAPAGAIVRADLSAVDFLRLVRFVQRHWVRAGEAPRTRSPGLHHNVSHTCMVRAGEWDAVARYLWRHRADFSGVALLADAALRRYPNAPVQPVVSAADARRWSRLRYRPVDYTRAGAARGAAGGADACKSGECDFPRQA
jgi:ribonucleoside-diphosphate reductase alpha chain